MIRQDDVLLNTMSELPFKEYGCALMDIAYHAIMFPTEREMENGLGYTFKRESFVSDCNKWVNSGALSLDLFVTWDRIAQDLGLPYRLVKEKGTHVLPVGRVLRDGELQIVQLYNPDTGKAHFVVMNKHDQVTYDSLGKSVTVAAYEKNIAYIKDRRIFRRI